MYFPPGTRNNIQLWDLENMSLVETKNEMRVKVWMLSFSFPFAFAVGGEDWRGLRVFNVTTGEKIRDIMVCLASHGNASDILFV